MENNVTEAQNNLTENVNNINEEVNNVTDDNVVEEVKNVTEESGNNTEVIEVIDSNDNITPDAKALLKAEKEKNSKEKKEGKKEKSKEGKEEKKGNKGKKEKKESKDAKKEKNLNHKKNHHEVEVTESIDDIINEVNDTLNGTVYLELDNEKKDSSILNYLLGIFIITCFVALIIIGTQYQKFVGKFSNDYQNESLTNYLLLDSLKKDEDYPSVTDF